MILSTVIEEQKKDPEIHYPCLMKNQNTDAIWLVTSFSCGTLLHFVTPSCVGEYHRCDLIMDVLELFNGEVILKNKC